MSSRMSRPELYMNVAHLYGRRSSCTRANVGVIAVRDGRIVAAGYCGAPSGQPHCIDVGCDVVDDHCVRTVHAEANMVAWAARTGISLAGCEAYGTHLPCLVCAQLIANAGIKRFIYREPYHDNLDLPKVRELLHVIDYRVAV
jgi:dCMP deaminase